MEVKKRRTNERIQIAKIVGNNIRKEREKRYLTTEELAEIIDVKVSLLNLIERGRRGATTVTLQRLVKTFDVSMDSFFEENNIANHLYEACEGEPRIYYKKITALISQLTEEQLEPLTHVITGALAMRKVIIDMESRK